MRLVTSAGSEAWGAVVPSGYLAVPDVPTSNGPVPMVLLGRSGAFVLDGVDWPGWHLRLERWMMVARDDADLLAHRLLRRTLDVEHLLERGGARLHVEPILIATDGALVASNGELERWDEAFDHLTVLPPAGVRPFIAARPPRHAARQAALAASVLHGTHRRMARAAGA